MDLGIAGRVAVVTGASKGLGFACAEALVREGAAVAIGARTLADLEAAATDLGDRFSGATVLPVAVDVTDAASIAAFAEEVRTRLGEPAILVSNAGGPPSGGYDDVAVDAYPAALELCFLSVVRLFDAFLPAMRRHGYGRVVQILSVAARQPLQSLVLSNAARAAVLGFAKTVSQQVAPDGVTVNVVLPGFTRTERLEELAAAVAAQAHITPQEVFAGWEELIPAGRLGKPKEIAAAVTFLCSEPASYVTGTSLAVDGGFVKGLP
jgi:3-oxoacyl-[acyl-carrier protein] reductase